GVELTVREVGEPLGALGVALGGGEHLVAFLHVGQTVVEQGEHVGCDLLAQAVTGAQILVDPDLHVRACSLLIRARWRGAESGLRCPLYTARLAETSCACHTPGRPCRRCDASVRWHDVWATHVYGRVAGSSFNQGGSSAGRQGR